MIRAAQSERCEWSDSVPLYLLAALSPDETESMAAHLISCAECRQEHGAVSLLTEALTAWRNDALLPTIPLWQRLSDRIKGSSRLAVSSSPTSMSSDVVAWPPTRWQEVAPGISCKILSTDREMDRVSVLVRLARGVAYPAHRHAGVEELHLLEGELWIDHQKLHAGDYYRAEPGSMDQRVWSATGCMCLLVTSPSDELR